jgi:sulfonate transport system substrate-binding protein
VAAVRAIVIAAGDVRTRPAGVWPLVSSRIDVPAATIATVWRHFRFPASLPGDLLDVLTEEERWVAVAQKRAPRGRAQLASLVGDTVLRDAR